MNVDRSVLRSHAVHPVPGSIECHDCGLIQDLPDSPPGHTVRCCRCHGWLRTTRRDPIGPALACTVAALILYGVALSMPMMTLDLRGRIHTVDLLTGPLSLLDNIGLLPAVGAVVLLATVLMPGVVIGANLMLLLGAQRQPVAAIVPHLLRLQQKFRPWSMIEVYMLGVFVAWSKLISLAHVELGPAIFSLAAIMVLTIAADSAFDARTVWDRIGIERDVAAAAVEAPRPGSRTVAIACHGCELVVVPGDTGASAEGERCPRCCTVLVHRKPDSLRRTVMFLVASAILYVPANILPVLTFTKLGQGAPSTILAGVVELYQSGMLPLAILVFVASITVPCLKILSLGLMAFMTQRRMSAALVDRTRLFRLVDFIGRWSMIDVFMISILVAIVHFGFLANVEADPGCVAFAAVVILTIFAANSFDPRLMWDAANGAVPRARRAARTPAPQQAVPVSPETRAA